MWERYPQGGMKILGSSSHNNTTKEERRQDGKGNTNDKVISEASHSHTTQFKLCGDVHRMAERGLRW